MRVRRTRSLVAAALGLSLLLTACGGGDGDGGGSGSGNGPSTQQVVFGSEKNPTGFNVLTEDGNVFDTQVIVNALWPAVYTTNPDFSVSLNEDLMVSAEQVSQSPQTIEYTIRPEAVWSDDTPISAADFEYVFNHLRGPENGGNENYSVASTAGYDLVQSLTGSPDGKKVTVVFRTPYPDWKGMFTTLLPAHYMATLGEDVAAWNEGLTGEKTVGISGGPYVVETYEDNKQVVLVRNEKYYGKRAEIDKVVFRIGINSGNLPQAIGNNEVHVAYPQAGVDLVQSLEGIEGVTSEMGFGPNFEHFDFNLANPALTLPLRRALFTALDREQLIGAGVGQFSPETKALDNRMFVSTLPGYQDNVTAEGFGSGKVEDAKKILTDAGYTGVGSALVDPQGKPVPTLRIVTTQGEKVREDQCNLFAAAAKELGVTMELSLTETLGKTLAGGEFDVVNFAWIGTPFPYSANRDLYVTGGGSNFNSYSNPVVDAALNTAAGTLDETEAQRLLNEADKQISKDAVTLPLYQKPLLLAFRDTLQNVVNNPTTVGPTYNLNEWTVR